jgi:transposase
MDVYKRIRTLYLRQNRSQREISRLLGVSRNTVRKYVKGEVIPPEEKNIERKSSLNQAVEPYIMKCLEKNKKQPKKQRMNAKHIWDYLCKEKGFKIGKSTVRRYVREIKAKHPEIFIPLSFEPGEAIQIDWGESPVYMRGKKRKVHYFCAVLPFSYGINVTVYPDSTMESFYMGHIKAFEFFKGVPLKCIYDNLKTAVLQGGGKKVVLQKRFKKLIAHYGFEPIFCNIRAAWEKGGVENLVSIARSIALTPMPRVKNFKELQQVVTQRCVQYCDNNQRKYYPESIKVMLKKEQKHLLPLPVVPMDPAKIVTARVHSDLTVHYKNVKYSVPASLAGREVTLKVDPFNICIWYQGEMIYKHKKGENEYDHQYIPQHYLKILERKPRAIENALPLKKGVMPPELIKFRKLCPEKNVNEQLVSILKLGQKISKEELLWAVKMANQSGNPNFNLVSFYLDIQNSPEPDLEKDNEYPKAKKDPDLNQYDDIMMGGKQDNEDS